MPEPDATPEAQPNPSSPSAQPSDPTGPQGSVGAGPSDAETGAQPAGKTIADSVADLIQLFVDYVRQETESVVRDKVVLPTQKAGQVVAFALAAAMTLFLGIAFVAVGSLMLLAYFVGWIAALYIVGAVLIGGAAGLSYAKVRKLQS